MTAGRSTTFTISESAFLAFCRYTYRRSIMRCLAPTIVVLAILGGVFLALGFGWLGALVPMLGGIAGAILFVAFNYVFVLPGRWRRNFREAPSLHEEITFAANAAGYTCEQASGIWHPTWSNMRKWEETNNFLAIFPNRTSGVILPRDQFDEEILDYVRARLVESGLPRPGKFRK